MSHMKCKAWLGVVLGLLAAGKGETQVALWKLGSSDLGWSEADSTHIFIDFESTPGSIQPVYFTPERTVFSHIDNWAFWRDPTDRVLEYAEGEMPRMWKWNHGIPDPSENGSLLVDGDLITYNAPKADLLEKETFTMDLAVPVPAVAFGFSSPSQGYRSDGTPLVTDAVPAFQISASVDPEPPVLAGNVKPLSTIIADIDQNLSPRVHIDLGHRYLRFIRYRRQLSFVDEKGLIKTGFDTNLSLALKGTIADFELVARGVPQRVHYRTKIMRLDKAVNFGRLFWKATPMRMVDGAPVEVADVQAQVKVEVRTGRDDDPAVYHEYMATGLEREVSRQRYENELRTRYVRVTGADDLTTRQPKPGLRASIGYDSDNWTFWSVPFTEPGQPLNLRSGSYLQVRVTLESDAFDDWVRLDSLWIETAPLLAGGVKGEMARLDDPQPRRGFTEVRLGEMTDFVYDLKADFENADAPGFDVLRIRTGSRAQFRSLFSGSPLLAVEPAQIVTEQDGLTIYLPQRIGRANNPPLRVIFGAEVFEFATTFLGEVLDTQRQVLPQPVVEGDVTDELSTNSLRVLAASGQSPDFIQELVFSSPVFTPNGDGVNDQLRINYALFRLPGAIPVVLSVYALDGRRVAKVEAGHQDSGRQQLVWDGRDGQGELLPPGLYLLGIDLQSELSTPVQIRPVGMVY